MTNDINDRTPCSHCGLPPLVVEDDRGALRRIDACFAGAIPGPGTSACCGHGDLSKAYVRFYVRTPDGSDEQVDLCGFVVQPYGAFLSEFVDPPKNAPGGGD